MAVSLLKQKNIVLHNYRPKFNMVRNRIFEEPFSFYMCSRTFLHLLSSGFFCFFFQDVAYASIHHEVANKMIIVCNTLFVSVHSAFVKCGAY